MTHTGYINECEVCGQDHGADVDDWTHHEADVVAQRAGASNRTADELARVFAVDVADITGIAVPADLPDPDGWCDDSDDSEYLSDYIRIAESHLGDAFHAVIWDDGYTIYRLSPPDDYVSAMLSAYVECALWSSLDTTRCDHCGEQSLNDSEECPTPDCTGYGNNPTLDANYGADDIAPEALDSMRSDVVAFATYQRDDLSNITPEHAGHDFWLTRNGHGAGFWDRGLGAVGDRLTEACRPYGSSDLYVGDDGRVYVS